jgi:cell division septation protein DedD
MPNWLKNILLSIMLLGVIVLSFWISFLIGKQMLIPVKKIPTGYLITGEATLPPPLSPEKISLEVETVKTAPLSESKTTKPAYTKTTVKKAEPTEEIYYIQSGLFSSKANAQKLVSDLKAKGYEASFKKAGKFYKVTAGEGLTLSEAKSQAAQIKASGFEAIVRRN